MTAAHPARLPSHSEHRHAVQSHLMAPFLFVLPWLMPRPIAFECIRPDVTELICFLHLHIIPFGMYQFAASSVAAVRLLSGPIYRAEKAKSFCTSSHTPILCRQSSVISSVAAAWLLFGPVYCAEKAKSFCTSSRSPILCRQLWLLQPWEPLVLLCHH